MENDCDKRVIKEGDTLFSVPNEAMRCRACGVTIETLMATYEVKDDDQGVRGVVSFLFVCPLHAPANAEPVQGSQNDEILDAEIVE